MLFNIDMSPFNPAPFEVIIEFFPDGVALIILLIVIAKGAKRR